LALLGPPAQPSGMRRWMASATPLGAGGSWRVMPTGAVGDAESQSGGGVGPFAVPPGPRQESGGTGEYQAMVRRSPGRLAALRDRSPRYGLEGTGVLADLGEVPDGVLPSGRFSGAIIADSRLGRSARRDWSGSRKPA